MADQTPEEKKQQAAEKQQVKLNNVLKTVVALKSQQPEFRLVVLAGITTPLPISMLTEAVESGKITSDYIDWLKENAPNVIKTYTSRSSGPAEPREYPSFIDKVDGASPELVDRGKAFQVALDKFKLDQAENIAFFADNFDKHWYEYFKLVKETEQEESESESNATENV